MTHLKNLLQTGAIHLATIIGIVAALIPAASQWLSLNTAVQVVITIVCLALFLRAVAAANVEKRKLQNQNRELAHVQEKLEKAELWNTSYSLVYKEVADLGDKELPLLQSVTAAKVDVSKATFSPERGALEYNAKELEEHYQRLLKTKEAATARLEQLHDAIIKLTGTNPELTKI